MSIEEMKNKAQALFKKPDVNEVLEEFAKNIK